jgi:hypothetical protein
MIRHLKVLLCLFPVSFLVFPFAQELPEFLCITQELCASLCNRLSALVRTILHCCLSGLLRVVLFCQLVRLCVCRSQARCPSACSSVRLQVPDALYTALLSLQVVATLNAALCRHHMADAACAAEMLEECGVVSWIDRHGLAI